MPSIVWHPDFRDKKVRKICLLEPIKQSNSKVNYRQIESKKYLDMGGVAKNSLS